MHVRHIYEKKSVLAQPLIAKVAKATGKTVDE